MKRSTSIILALVVAFSALLVSCGRPAEPTISWYLAIQRGDIDQVERHIYWGTDINTPFPSGRYPLHEAAVKGRIILLDMLIDAGARVDVKDGTGRSALDLAILNGRIQAAWVLIRADAQHDPSQLLLLAAKRDVEDRDVVAFLKELGADMNATDENGDTALLIAISRNNNRLVNHLVEHGVDVNLPNREGRSPLRVAQDQGALEIQQLLLRNGATLRGRQPLGQ